MRYIFNKYNTKDDLHISFRSETINNISRSYVSIEIELHKEYTPYEMDAIVKDIYIMHNGWNVPNLVQTISSMKNILTTYGITSPFDLQTPYDITWRDITYDRLIADAHAISFKADGVRMLYVSSTVGTFFVTSQLNIIPISITPSNDIYVVDGELLSSNVYWIFDLIYLNGMNYKQLPMTIRHDNIPTINSILSPMSLPLIPEQNIHSESDIITVNIKPIIIPSTVDEFFSAIESMYRYTDRNDGLIISRINQEYSANVFKWKPSALMSVDFFIGKDYILGTYDNGTILWHDDYKAIDIPSNMIGTIGEFKYIDGTTWSYVRSRSDKARPNAEKVLQAILRLHRDPISYDVLTGHSLQLMRKYHNRVKRATYSMMRAYGINTLTDVGSGRGGDLDSWRENNLDVNAIEPNMSNITELYRRASNMDAIIDDNIIQGECWSATVYPMSVEEYIDDMPEQTDGLSLFNSATFLSLNTLCILSSEVVKDTGLIILMVIDGKVLVNEFLHDKDRYLSSLINIDRLSENRIFIRLINSSTVSEGQEENILDIENILDMYSKIGWRPDIDMYLTQEKLMGKEEYMYSSAQRLIIMRRVYTSGHTIRKIYKPLVAGKIENIDSPWGNVLRIGTLGTDSDSSFTHSLLQSYDSSYRVLDNISKTIYASSRRNTVMRDILRRDIPIYMIPHNSWNMNDAQYIYQPQANRKPGIVIINNEGHWESLGKRVIGDSNAIQYIW